MTQIRRSTHQPPRERTITDALVAGSVAGVVSGLPSTLHALAGRRSPLAGTRAAGTLLGRPAVGRGLLAHALLSLGWGLVLTRLLPRRHLVFWGAGAGLVIAALDLGLVGRRYPAIADLEPVPQVIDHVVFGAVVGATLAFLERSRTTVGGSSPGRARAVTTPGPW